MSTPIRILQIEDSEADALLIERELRRADFEPFCYRVEYETEMARILAAEIWDVIIADYTMPRFSGLHAFQVYRESGLDIPFIIVSGSIGEDLAVEAMKSGIHDYVMKNNLARLAPAIRREMREAVEREARRQAETRLRDVERLRTIGELTASLIHDLKNPLQSILGSAELLRTEGMDPEGRQKYCSIISRQVERMVSMSQEVLAFARGEMQLNVKPIDPLNLLCEIVETYADAFAASGIHLRCKCDSAVGKPLLIHCDEQKIWRALHNLISNAKDAMLDGGTIDLVVKCDSREVTFEVADNGPGIPETIRERLFEPFVTHGKKQGTGLGLAIVKNVAEAHRGSIRCESTAGVGTRFIVTFPVDSTRRMHSNPSSIAMNGEKAQSRG